MTMRNAKERQTAATEPQLNEAKPTRIDPLRPVGDDVTASQHDTPVTHGAVHTHPDLAMGVATDPGPPPEMDVAAHDARPQEQHRTPVGINEDCVDEAIEALTKAASKRVEYFPQSGRNVADTASLDVDDRVAVAYQGSVHSLPAGHPTPPPQESIVVQKTPVLPVSAPAARRSPEPLAVADEASPLSALLDSVDSDLERDWVRGGLSRAPQRDVPTYVPPIRQGRRIIPAAKVSLGAAITVAASIGIAVAIRAVRAPDPVRASTTAPTAVDMPSIARLPPVVSSLPPGPPSSSTPAASPSAVESSATAKIPRVVPRRTGAERPRTKPSAPATASSKPTARDDVDRTY